MKGRRSLEASGGDGSTNVAAGRDVTFIGADRAEIEQVALDVFRRNFLELREVAKEVALGRAERLTTEYLDRLSSEMPERLRVVEDPDIQRTTYCAQREYACSGEDELKDLLVDLLVERTGEDGRTLRVLALNGAISAAPKLTEAQRRAIALVFILRYARYAGEIDPTTFHKVHIGESIITIAAPGLPDRNVDFQHIEYVGAGAVTILGSSFAQVVINGAQGMFSAGFTPDEVPDDAKQLLVLTIPNPRHVDRIQLGVLGQQDLDARIDAAGLESDLVEAAKSLMDRTTMTEEEVLHELIEENPAVEGLAEAWSSTDLRNLTLTSVGLAIGHAYWERFTGSTAPLSIWL